MQENELREKHIQALMKKGARRKVAEETVDLVDDDGNVVGLISENELVIELLFRDIFRDSVAAAELETEISPPFPGAPHQVFLNIEGAMRRLAENKSAPPQSDTKEQ